MDKKILWLGGALAAYAFTRQQSNERQYSVKKADGTTVVMTETQLRAAGYVEDAAGNWHTTQRYYTIKNDDGTTVRVSESDLRTLGYTEIEGKWLTPAQLAALNTKPKKSVDWYKILNAGLNAVLQASSVYTNTNTQKT